MVRPTVFMRLAGPSANFVALARALCDRGFTTSLLLERSDDQYCWVEIETEGTVEDLDSLCSSVGRLSRSTSFSIREYGPQLTAAAG